MQQRLYEWILHPEYLNKDSLFELRNLLARYPYFQTVRHESVAFKTADKI